MCTWCSFSSIFNFIDDFLNIFRIGQFTSELNIRKICKHFKRNKKNQWGFLVAKPHGVFCNWYSLCELGCELLEYVICLNILISSDHRFGRFFVNMVQRQKIEVDHHQPLLHQRRLKSWLCVMLIILFQNLWHIVLKYSICCKLYNMFWHIRLKFVTRLWWFGT